MKARIKALTEKIVANGCTEAMSAAEIVGLADELATLLFVARAAPP